MDSQNQDEESWSMTKASIAGGPVTCLCIVSDTCILVARGAFLDIVKNESTTNRLIFPTGGTIHGVHRLDDLIVVYGGRQVAFLNLKDKGGDEELVQCFIQRQPESDCIQHPSFLLQTADWIHDVALSAVDTDTHTMVLAQANNTCDVWRVARLENPAHAIAAERRQKIVAEARCITYAMAFPTWSDRSGSDLVVASGTVRNDILLWTALVGGDSKAAMATTTKREISHTLQGHEGVILALKFSHEGQHLASASDDRSVRLWVKADAEWLASFVCWGHTARVWDVSFSADKIISSSEDGTVRIWHLENGEQVGEMRSYPPQSMWCLDVASTSVIVGCNDGVARTFDIRDSQVVSAKDLTILVPDDRIQIQGPPPPETPNDDARGETKSKKSKRKNRHMKTIEDQVVFGINFYDTETKSPKLLLATRAGSLMSFTVEQKSWSQLHPWWEPSMQGLARAREGTCMATCNGRAALGTSRGLLVVMELSERQNAVSRRIGRGEQFKSIQGVAWIDQTLLVSMHIKGTAIVWSLATNSLSRLRVLNTTLEAIPSCICYRSGDGLLLLGDSRGNIACFKIQGGNDSENVLRPHSLVERAHRKEHVNCITNFGNDRIVSVGNDGRLLECRVDNEGKLEKQIALPITGLSSVNEARALDGEEEGLIASGYFGNTYVSVDLSRGRDIFRFDTEGRHRKLDAFVGRNNDGYIYGVCVCVSKKDGRNELVLQTHFPSSSSLRPGYRQLGNLGQHFGPVFDCCLFKTRSSVDYVACLSGGEDCTGRLSIFQGASVAYSKQLPPQESCVRAVSASQLPASHTTLLVVGGGKLSVQFFLLRDLNSVSCESILDGVYVSQLGVGRIPTETSIDQRINAVKATPLQSLSGNSKHLVVVGDSSGSVTFFVVDESPDEPRFSIRGSQLAQLPRPALSIEVLAVAGRHLLMVGTTGGDICFWDLPLDEQSFDQSQISSKPICKVEAHQMGTNSISASVLEDGRGLGALVLVCSGGDDQSLTALRLRLPKTDQEDVSLEIATRSTIREASASAIKGVRIMSNNAIVSVGYSQRLGLWHLTPHGELEFLRSVPIDVADVNSLGIVSTSMDEAIAAVGGEGLEFVHIQHQT